MFQRLFLFPILLLLTLAIGHFGCGSGTDAGGTPGQITLTLTTPNGVDPVSGATVWIPASSSISAAEVQIIRNSLTDSEGETCDEPTETASDSECTNAAGQATLTCSGTGSTTVKYLKGSFSGSTTISCGAAPATAPVATTSINMAVVTGEFDRMQDVLAKLGFGTVTSLGRLELGTQTFTLYDGDDTLSDTDYDNWADVMLDTTKLALHDIIFINCDEFVLGDELDTDTSTKIANLRSYVLAGGKLYVTDLSYDYVEQAFPEFVNFKDGGSGTSAETAGAAEDGSNSFFDENATVEVAALGTWLDGRTVNTGNNETDCSTTTVNGTTGARNTDGSIFIGDFLSGWAMMDGAEAGATITTWITGTDVDSQDRPLTVTFDAGSSGGRVLYSSYHTSESCPTTGFWPQERVLQYLVFEL